MRLLLLGISVAVVPLARAQSPLQDISILAVGLGDATVPGLSDSGVAFRDYRNSSYGIYYVDLLTEQVQQVTGLFYAEVDVATSVDRLAWVGYPSGTQADVFVHDLSDNTTS